MRQWGPATIIVATVVALAGCGGSVDDASADASTTTRRALTTTTSAAPSTTTVPVTTTTSAPPPLYSFDGSVPPPPLNLTGDDFDAIYRSLNGYLTWLYAHHPDPALVGEIATIGSEQFDIIAEDLRQLANDGLRLFDDETIIESVEVASALRDVTTLRVDFSPGHTVLVDSSGSIRDEAATSRLRQIIVLVVQPHGGWELSAASDVVDDPVVVVE